MKCYDIEENILEDGIIKYFAMSENDANMISKFIEDHHPVNLYVHCEAGISRSAGIAAAIVLWQGMDDRYIFKTKCPNMNCYRKTYKALSGKNANDPYVFEKGIYKVNFT